VVAAEHVTAASMVLTRAAAVLPRSAGPSLGTRELSAMTAPGRPPTPLMALRPALPETGGAARAAVA
jgi:hypothetical protein